MSLTSVADETLALERQLVSDRAAHERSHGGNPTSVLLLSWSRWVHHICIFACVNSARRAAATGDAYIRRLWLSVFKKKAHSRIAGIEHFRTQCLQ